LLASLRQRGVALLTLARATSLTRGPAGIDGLVLVQDRWTRRVQARGGVILATGGFVRHPAQRAARLPDIDLDWCAAAPGSTGLAASLAEAHGAAWGSGAATNAYLAPVSLQRRGDGTIAVFAHLERLPRQIFVDADGDCDVDAGMPHHAAALAMHDAMTMPVHLVTDAKGLHANGLGFVGPAGRGLDGALRDGYVRRAHDLRDLAHTLQVPAATLERQLRRHLARAYTGVARVVEFTPPYYAVEVVPGDLAAACGLATDERARVLDGRGDPIAGLYAVGGDMHSMMGGVLPAPGCMLGPALVFAVIAASDATMRGRLVQRVHDASRQGPTAQPLEAHAPGPGNGVARDGEPGRPHLRGSPRFER
jgi:hypothetical protein